MEYFDEVQDPSDFPIDTLRKLDSSLRCPICKEFFDGPVLLHCGHTFCSLCVRNLLPTKPECPKCRAPAKELHLTRNAMFEEAVTAWSEARPHTLRLARAATRSSQSPPANVSRGTKRKAHKDTCAPEAGPSKIMLRENNKSRKFQAEQDEEEYPHGGEDGAPSDVNSPVSCPLCDRDIPYNLINQHMDSDCKRYTVDSADTRHACKQTETRSKAAWGAIFDGQGKNTTGGARDSEVPLKKLAKVSYGVMKTHDLRRLLADSGLPTTGERQQLVFRHQQWVAINNANLDREQPRTIRDLKRKLKEMEAVGNHSTPKKVHDEKEHTRRYGAQFASLVEKARPKVTRLEEPTTPGESSVLPVPIATRQSPPSLSPSSSVIEID